MKKRIVYSLVLALAILSISAFAESIDLSQYNDNELIDLHSRIQQEMADRKIEKSAILQEGRYTVGKDLPSGTYMVSMKYEKDSWWGSIYIYTDESENSKKLFDETVFASDEPGDGKNEGVWKITLEEGNVLACTYPINLTIFSGVQFQ